MQSDGWIRSISDFRPKKVLIVTALLWANLAAGERVVLLNPVNVLIKPYLQAILLNPVNVLIKPYLQAISGHHGRP